MEKLRLWLAGGKCQAEEALKYLPQTCALYGLTGQQEHFVGKGLAGLLTIWPGRPLALKKMPGLEGLKIPPSDLCIVWPNRPARTLCWERPCRPSDYMAWQATGSKENAWLRKALKYLPQACALYGLTGQQEHFVGKALQAF